MVAFDTTGIDVVPVLKTALLKVLEENKIKHESEFQDAFVGYQQTWLEEAKKAKAKAEKRHAKAMRNLDKAVATAEAAVKKEQRAKFPSTVPGVDASFSKPPVCHTPDYETAMRMITMFQPNVKDQPGVIELSVSDFMSYCEDNWDWKQKHRDTISNYSNGPSGPQGAAGNVGPGGVHALLVNWE